MANSRIPIFDMSVRIYGPHIDGEFNMSANTCFINAAFVSPHAAVSWLYDLDGAEIAWRDGGQKPLTVRKPNQE